MWCMIIRVQLYKGIEPIVRKKQKKKLTKLPFFAQYLWGNCSATHRSGRDGRKVNSGVLRAFVPLCLLRRETTEIQNRSLIYIYISKFWFCRLGRYVNSNIWLKILTNNKAQKKITLFSQKYKVQILWQGHKIWNKISQNHLLKPSFNKEVCFFVD